jgi:hypothetical protein
MPEETKLYPCGCGHSVIDTDRYGISTVDRSRYIDVCVDCLGKVNYIWDTEPNIQSDLIFVSQEEQDKYNHPHNVNL